jgi:3,4-dihydroxy 2-butanone 4-phosphate synthase/GTP cyclohydrolase II
MVEDRAEHAADVRVGEPWSLAVDEPRASTADAIEALRAGRCAVVVDGSGIESSCVVACAERIGDDAVALMLLHARGVPSLALSEAQCEALRLRPQAIPRDARSRDTMVAIEARTGVTTGVSTADRARTMRVAAAHGATDSDIVVPGHVPVVRVRPDARLRNPTLAEAAFELARSAGSRDAAAFCHILEDGGHSAYREAALDFARAQGLPAVTTDDVRDLRLREETLVVAEEQTRIVTDHGPFVAHRFRETASGAVHVAMVLGDVRDASPSGVAVLTQDLVAEVFAARWSPHRVGDVLGAIAAAGRGVLLYLAPRQLREPHADGGTHAALPDLVWQSHIATQILKALGVRAVCPLDRGSAAYA